MICNCLRYILLVPPFVLVMEYACNFEIIQQQQQQQPKKKKKKKKADKYWLRNDLFIMYSWTVGPVSVGETCRVQRIYLYYVFIFEIKFYKDTV